DREGAARSEVDTDDRRVLKRVDQKEVAVRARDNRARIPPRVGGVRRVVNPDLVVAEVDHQFDRTARQNSLPGMRWRVRTKPEAVDELVKRRTRDIGTQEHGHGPQELGYAAELRYDCASFQAPSFSAALTSPCQDHFGMCKPSGTSSAESWYRDIVVAVAHVK